MRDRILPEHTIVLQSQNRFGQRCISTVVLVVERRHVLVDEDNVKEIEA